MVCHAGAVVVSALVGMGALLLAAAVLSAGSALRLHSAYREALRELRDGDRRLEPGAGPGRRLEDELRWYADVTAAGRDSGWRYAAAVVVGACVGVVVLAVWTFTVRPPALSVATAVVLLALMLVVTGLCLLEGRRFERLLHAAGRRSALGGVRRLEDTLVQVQRATADLAAANRHLAAHPVGDIPVRAAAGPLAAPRGRPGHRPPVPDAGRARPAVPVDLAGIAVRPPDGYSDGVRALTPMAARRRRWTTTPGRRRWRTSAGRPSGTAAPDPLAVRPGRVRGAARRPAGPRVGRALGPGRGRAAGPDPGDAPLGPAAGHGRDPADPAGDLGGRRPPRPRGRCRPAAAGRGHPPLGVRAGRGWPLARSRGHGGGGGDDRDRRPGRIPPPRPPRLRGVGATSAQLSRLVPQWHAPDPGPDALTGPDRNDRTPRAPVRARLSLLPSGPGEVHEVDAARGVGTTLPGPPAAVAAR